MKFADWMCESEELAEAEFGMPLSDVLESTGESAKRWYKAGETPKTFIRHLSKKQDSGTYTSTGDEFDPRWEL